MIRKFSKSVWWTVAAMVAAVALIPFDLAILQFIQTYPAAQPVFDVITEAGRSHWYLIPSAVVFLWGLYLWRMKKTPAWYAKYMHPAMLMFASVAMSGLVVNIIKPIASRARPRQFLDEEIHGFWNLHEVWDGQLSHYNSFPSGHAATALSAAVTIILCLPEKYNWARIPVLVMGCIVAVSRVMVSVHYTSDVIVGSLIGAWAAVLCHRYLLRAEWAAAISRPATLQ